MLLCRTGAIERLDGHVSDMKKIMEAYSELLVLFG